MGQFNCSSMSLQWYFILKKLDNVVEYLHYLMDFALNQ